MLENIRLSFQGIWSHKMRSFLTMLGIIIGIASIISIVSTIKGTNEQIKENLIGSGNNAVNIKLNQGDSEYQMEYMGVPSGVFPVSEEQKKQIQKIDGVDKVSYYQSREYAEGIYYKDTQLSGGKILGIDMSYLSTSGYVISAGRNLLPSDYEKYQKVALVDETSAAAMFLNENPIGKTIEIKGEPFIVVGIVKQSKQFEPVINSMEDYNMYTQQNAGAVYIPKATWPVIYNYDEPENIIVKAKNTEAMSNIGKKTADILNSGLANQEGDIKYKAADLLEKAKNLQELGQSTNQQLLWIASISLLVGGIGVMNIMLVSVTERTSEIGLKKAIGARKKKILWQFLTEAAVLTSIGGLIGVIVGVVMAQVISKVSQAPVAISYSAIVGSVIFSMAIGIIFGLLPSFKAANLNPIDALRRE